jgi:hypothetical protein
MLEKLSDEVMEMQASLDNFVETKEDVQGKMELAYSMSEDKQLKILNSSLKRMILA